MIRCCDWCEKDREGTEFKEDNGIVYFICNKCKKIEGFIDTELVQNKSCEHEWIYRIGGGRSCKKCKREEMRWESRWVLDKARLEGWE